MGRRSKYCLVPREPTYDIQSTRYNPHEKYYGKKPDVSHVRIFGSIAYVHVPDEKWQNVDPNLEKCILVGVKQDMGSHPSLTHKKAISCRWKYKLKYNTDGFFNRYKPRLVAKGYAQTYRVGYEETISLVAKMIIVRTVIALAVAKGWHLHQMDIKKPLYGLK